MAGQVSSFLSSAKLAIKMGDLTLAYATNLSLTDRMAVAPVGGIGSFSPDALEPLQYSATGTMTMTIYTSEAWNVLNTINTTLANGALPNRATGHSDSATGNNGRSGNSLMSVNSFSPAHLIISRSFDIDVYERKSPTAAPFGIGADLAADAVLTYQLLNCRLTTYSLTFTPGSLIQETVGFIALTVVDKAVELAKNETLKFV